jgi:hypothetical protein
MECDISRGSSEVPVIVTAAIALTGLTALITGSLCQLLCLSLQQFVQGLFDTATNQFFDLTLDYFLV